jgi:tripartite-type tricarboxylate transporter receptor subunit TctC
MLVDRSGEIMERLASDGPEGTWRMRLLTAALVLKRTLKGRRGLAAALCGFSVLGSGAVLADEFPTRPVRVIVPFAPGGATDVLARTLNTKLSEKFGKQFYVENKVGAGGAIGAKEVASAPPDGHVLLVYHVGLVASALLQKPAPYDPVADFTPIALLATAPNIVSVNPKVPVRDFADLVAQGRAKPGELNYGSSGFGGSDHLAMELLQTLTKAKFTHVPFRGGAPAVLGGITGDVQIVLQSAGTVGPQVQGGQLRGLAVTGKTRLAMLPDVPTAAEAGFPEFDQSAWFGLWGSPGIPQDIVQKLSQAVRESLAHEDVRASLEKVGLIVETGTPQEFATLVRDERARWTQVLGQAGLLPK